MRRPFLRRKFPNVILGFCGGPNLRHGTGFEVLFNVLGGVMRSLFEFHFALIVAATLAVGGAGVEANARSQNGDSGARLCQRIAAPGVQQKLFGHLSSSAALEFGETIQGTCSQTYVKSSQVAGVVIRSCLHACEHSSRSAGDSGEIEGVESGSPAGAEAEAGGASTDLARAVVEGAAPVVAPTVESYMSCRAQCFDAIENLRK
jgi:hypothetical protein